MLRDFKFYKTANNNNHRMVWSLLVLTASCSRKSGGSPVPGGFPSPDFAGGFGGGYGGGTGSDLVLVPLWLPGWNGRGRYGVSSSDRIVRLGGSGRLWWWCLLLTSQYYYVITTTTTTTICYQLLSTTTIPPLASGLYLSVLAMAIWLMLGGGGRTRLIPLFFE